MATIVRHSESGWRFVLLGTGIAAFSATKSHPLWGSLSHVSESGTYSLMCVCNAAGEIAWYRDDELVVESVDGVSPGAALR